MQAKPASEAKTARKSSQTARTVHWLSLVATIGVGVIAVASFTLSFDTLSKLAANQGHVHAWLFPLSLDLGIIIYSLVSIVRQFQGANSKVENYLIIGATVASVLLNVFAENTHMALKVAVYALPPLFLAGAVESIKRILSLPMEQAAQRAARAAVTREQNKAKGKRRKVTV